MFVLVIWSQSTSALRDTAICLEKQLKIGEILKETFFTSYMESKLKALCSIQKIKTRLQVAFLQNGK